MQRGRPRVEPSQQRVKVQVWIKPYHKDMAQKFADKNRTSLSALCRKILEKGINNLQYGKIMKTKRGEKDRLAPTCHRDGTVTYWSVYNQKWIKKASQIPEKELARMYKYRERVMKHMGIKQSSPQ